jgi:hypothetical protein
MLTLHSPAFANGVLVKAAGGWRLTGTGFGALCCRSLLRQKSTILFDMARKFYSHDVCSIADGAGNVVVNVVAWAGETIGPPQEMTIDGP